MKHYSISSILISISLLFSGCMTTYPQYGPYSYTALSKKEERIQNWEPLIEGSSLMVDTNYKYHPKEMKLQNGMILRNEDWEEYLKDYLLSQPIEKRDAIARGLSRYYKNYDKVEKVIRFSTIRYISEPYHAKSYISARGSISGDRIKASLKIQYYGSSWIFADRIKVVADDYQWESPKLYFKRDNYTKVWEYTYLDLSDPVHRQLAEKIIESDESIIRFYGKQYYEDLTVTKRMKDDLRAILGTIDALTLN